MGRFGPPDLFVAAGALTASVAPAGTIASAVLTLHGHVLLILFLDWR